MIKVFFLVIFCISFTFAKIDSVTTLEIYLDTIKTKITTLNIQIDTIKIPKVKHDTVTVIKEIPRRVSIGKTLSGIAIILSGITAGTIAIIDNNSNSPNNKYWAKGGTYDIQIAFSVGLILVGISTILN